MRMCMCVCVCVGGGGGGCIAMKFSKTLKCVNDPKTDYKFLNGIEICYANLLRPPSPTAVSDKGSFPIHINQ